MSGFELTNEEALLARAAASGEICDLRDRPGVDVCVRADAIRRLLLGLPVRFPGDVKAERVVISGPGLRLTNGVVTGRLELDDARSIDGRACPPMALESCVLDEPIFLGRAYLRRLSLRGSKVTHVCAPGLWLDGPLDISELATAEADHDRTGADGQGLCWVELQGAKIEGGIECNGSALVAPPKRPNFDTGSPQTRYALQLWDVHIRDRLELEPGARRFRAVGGISLRGADIGGDVWARGAELISEEGSAFRAQTSKVRGFVILRAWAGVIAGEHVVLPFTADGDIWFQGAKITGSLDIAGAHLNGGLVATIAEIGGSALLCGWEERVANERKTLPFHAADAIILHSAKIGGSLAMDGAQLKGGLNITNTQIAGDVFLCGWPAEASYQDMNVPFRAFDDVVISGANITGSLQMSNTELAKGASLRNATVGRTLRVDLDGKAVTQAALFSLQYAKVGTLEDKGGAGFPDSLRLQLDGFEYARLANVPSDETVGGMAVIAIAAQAWIRKISSLGSTLLLLAAVFAAGLITDSGRHGQWGLIAFCTVSALCIIWAFVGIDFGPNLSDARLKWIAKQYERKRPGRHTYSPDAYEKITRYFRNEGRYADARRIASARLTIERDLLAFSAWRPFLRVFEVCFDYGLSPLRAVCTFLVILGVGWAGAAVADRGLTWKPPFERWLNSAGFYTPAVQPVLMVTTSTVNSTIAPDRKHKFIPALAGVTNNQQPLLLCNSQVEPLLYAADTFIPAINLDQRNRCSVSDDPDAWPWRIGQALYTVIGWVVTSLTILTVSGVLRRQAET